MTRWTRLFVLPLCAALFFTACEADTDTETAPADEVEVEVMEPTPELDAEPEMKVNLNEGTDEDFRHLMPDLSDRMIHEFEEYRPYVSIQQFRREMAKYVDEATIADYERFVYVPVHWSDSDAETLTQLPGIDATEAQALVDARPFADRFAFLEALAAYASEDEITQADMYLVADA